MEIVDRGMYPDEKGVPRRPDRGDRLKSLALSARDASMIDWLMESLGDGSIDSRNHQLVRPTHFFLEGR